MISFYQPLSSWEAGALGHLSSDGTARTTPGAYEEFLELTGCVQRKGTLGKEELTDPISEVLL